MGFPGRGGFYSKANGLGVGFEGLGRANSLVLWGTIVLATTYCLRLLGCILRTGGGAGGCVDSRGGFIWVGALVVISFVFRGALGGRGEFYGGELGAGVEFCFLSAGLGVWVAGGCGARVDFSRGHFISLLHVHRMLADRL